MTRQEFKARWESNSKGDGITYNDIAKAAIDWGITKSPYAMQIDDVRYRVLKSAGTDDAEMFNPEAWPEEQN